eukprot:29580-Pelagococcus_subviridis.AAC.10
MHQTRDATRLRGRLATRARARRAIRPAQRVRDPRGAASRAALNPARVPRARLRDVLDGRVRFRQELGAKTFRERDAPLRRALRAAVHRERLRRGARGASVGRRRELQLLIRRRVGRRQEEARPRRERGAALGARRPARLLTRVAPASLLRRLSRRRSRSRSRSRSRLDRRRALLRLRRRLPAGRLLPLLLLRAAGGFRLLARAPLRLRVRDVPRRPIHPRLPSVAKRRVFFSNRIRRAPPLLEPLHLRNSPPAQPHALARIRALQRVELPREELVPSREQRRRLADGGGVRERVRAAARLPGAVATLGVHRSLDLGPRRRSLRERGVERGERLRVLRVFRRRRRLRLHLLRFLRLRRRGRVVVVVVVVVGRRLPHLLRPPGLFRVAHDVRAPLRRAREDLVHVDDVARARRREREPDDSVRGRFGRPIPRGLHRARDLRVTQPSNLPRELQHARVARLRGGVRLHPRERKVVVLRFPRARVAIHPDFQLHSIARARREPVAAKRRRRDGGARDERVHLDVAQPAAVARAVEKCQSSSSEPSSHQRRRGRRARPRRRAPGSVNHRRGVARRPEREAAVGGAVEQLVADVVRLRRGSERRRGAGDGDRDRAPRPGVVAGAGADADFFRRRDRRVHARGDALEHDAVADFLRAEVPRANQPRERGHVEGVQAQHREVRGRELVRGRRRGRGVVRPLPRRRGHLLEPPLPPPSSSLLLLLSLEVSLPSPLDARLRGVPVRDFDFDFDFDRDRDIVDVVNDRLLSRRSASSASSDASSAATRARSHSRACRVCACKSPGAHAAHRAATSLAIASSPRASSIFTSADATSTASGHSSKASTSASRASSAARVNRASSAAPRPALTQRHRAPPRRRVLPNELIPASDAPAHGEPLAARQLRDRAVRIVLQRDVRQRDRHDVVFVLRRAARARGAFQLEQSNLVVGGERRHRPRSPRRGDGSARRRRQSHRRRRRRSTRMWRIWL